MTKPNNNKSQVTQETTKPVKATDRMAPQFTGYAEGRKPNVSSNERKRP